MVEDNVEPVANPAEPNDAEDDSENEDDVEEENQQGGIVNEILKSPLYFACAFTAIGAGLHASTPFINWFTLWFLWTQMMMMCGVGMFCFGLGMLAVSQYEYLADMSNAGAKALHLPKRIELVTQ